MRHAYPLIWCFPEDVQAKFLGRISDRDLVPDRVWTEWKEPTWVTRSKDTILGGVDIDKFMRQTPWRNRE